VPFPLPGPFLVFLKKNISVLIINVNSIFYNLSHLFFLTSQHKNYFRFCSRTGTTLASWVRLWKWFDYCWNFTENLFFWAIGVYTHNLWLLFVVVNHGLSYLVIWLLIEYLRFVKVDIILFLQRSLICVRFATSAKNSCF
jgi:hypothetical protein